MGKEREGGRQGRKGRGKRGERMVPIFHYHILVVHLWSMVVAVFEKTCATSQKTYGHVFLDFQKKRKNVTP